MKRIPCFNRLLTALCASSSLLALSATAALAAPQVDLSSLPENAVTVYTQGDEATSAKDLLPILSGSSGYSEKWEMFLDNEQYDVRLKFEISNFAFSKNEGKLKGSVKKHTPNGDVVYNIDKTLKKGEWKADTNNLDLQFDDCRLVYNNGEFRLTGVYEKGTFEYIIPENMWKPGTGNVYFGNSEDNVFKFGVMTFYKQAKGTLTEDGQTHEITADAYGNHYATTLAVYDMFDEFADFRKFGDDVYVEFRYYIPSAKYQSEPFGFMIVAYKDTPVLVSTKLERTTLDTWIDDEHYGYEINARQRIVAKEDGNTATFEMLKVSPTAKDPYADLPAFQRNIASRFAKPIEYDIKMNWELYLDVDNIKAKIPKSNGYSIVKMR